MPSVSIVIWEMKRDRDAPLKARKSGRCGPVKHVQDKYAGDDRQGRADDPAGGLQQEDDQHEPKMMSHVVGTPARER